MNDRDRNLPLQDSNSIMQKSDEYRGKYHLGYKQLIQSQTLRTKIIRIAWQTVTRFPNEIQGVKELKKIEIIPQTNFARVLTVTRIRANLRDRFFKLTVKKKKKKKETKVTNRFKDKIPVFPNGTLRIQ